MTLDGRSVVVCRAAHQAGPLFDRLTQLGATAVHVPLVEVVAPLDDGDELRAAIAASSPASWFAFTSANGVDAVARVLNGVAPVGRVAVVGGATAERARRHGWEIAAVASVATAAGLGASLPVGPGDHVVAPLAELASGDLSDVLAERGVEVEVVTAYRTVAPPVSLVDRRRIAESDAVLVTAPSVISRLVEVMDPSGFPPLIAIGPTSAGAVEALGLAVAAQADEPSVDGLIAAVVRTLSL